MSSSTSLTPQEVASFLAATAIAGATAFIDGRSDAAALAKASDDLAGKLLLAGSDPATNGVLDPTRMLVICMMHAAIATGPRLLRWQAIMVSIVDLVRTENAAMRGEPDAPRWHRPRANDAVLQGARAC